MRNVCNISVRIHVETRALGIPLRGWEDNIRMNVREVGWEGVEWIHLAQDRDHWRDLVNTIINHQVM
jgi:hypothetical protein